MRANVFLTCLGLLLGPTAFAQSTPSSEPQPPASAQVQSDTKTKVEAQKTSDKKDDSDRDRKMHVRLGEITVAAGYARFPGSFFYRPYWPYGFYPYSFGYSPLFYDPFYAPFYGPFYDPFFTGPYRTGFSYAPDKGEVKLNVSPKDAQVFVDGAYAGTADHLKNIWLDSGAYNLSVSAPGREPFQQRIYV